MWIFYEVKRLGSFPGLECLPPVYAWLLFAFLAKESAECAQRDVIGVVWYYLEDLWRIVGSGASSSLLLELIGSFLSLVEMN